MKTPTDTELTAYNLVAQGKPLAQIAASLDMSESTVRENFSRARRKAILGWWTPEYPPEDLHLPELAPSVDAEPLPRPSKSCPVPGCGAPIRARFIVCAFHWKSVPHEIQSRIWHHFRRGQDLDNQPSAEYLAAANAAIEAATAFEESLPF